MMKALVSVAAVALVVGPALTLAQVRPDFSGRWGISQANSSAGAVGNSAKVIFPSELIVMQHPGELHVEMRFARAADTITAVYKFDGSDITLSTPAGITETARATWEGQQLVITARRVVSTAFGDFVTDTKEMWSRTGNVLTVRKTQSTDGLAATETAIFEYGKP
jgi:hypothetical protein